MSYDLTVQFDDDFSESSSLKPIRDWLLLQPGVKPNGEFGCLLDVPEENLWMEVDFEVSEGGSDTVQFDCIRSQIPYDNLGDTPEITYFPLLLNLAKQMDWQVFDAQSGEMVSSS